MTYLFILGSFAFGQCNLYGEVLNEEDDSPVAFASVFLMDDDTSFTLTDEFGRYNFENVTCGPKLIAVNSMGYKGFKEKINIKGNEFIFNISIIDTLKLGVVNVHADPDFSSRSMRTIEHMVLTHGKKTQLINVQDISGNKSTNNARELFATVPGLNIWESDGGGLQLGIGARGLSPNRTAHFNTRQNGYDISADALGYPETYYTPPAEAIQDIQMIRGAASLQFGPQFGGMLNFDLIKPSSKKFQYQGQHTYGGYNLFSTFNSVSGTLKKRFSYLLFYKYKQGDGWRDNSEFSQQNAYGLIKYNFTEKFFISAEYTYMSYLAQQAGGLTDALFEQNPQQSIRERNWFNVNWNLFSIHSNWEINSTTKIDAKIFKVIAARNALGNLDKISRLDDYLERDLIKGDFNNLGAELRFLKHYPIGKKMKGSLVTGARFYQGKTISQQGLADDGFDANFNFLNPNNLEGSDYTFPSNNYSAFAENMVRLTKKLWISGGLRYEYIQTIAEGQYRQINYHPLTNEVLFDTTFTENKSNQRNILLAGFGATYKISKHSSIYSNISQNYRGINFSDVRIVNPNQRVDENIQDEKGFNADLGFKKKTKKLQFDCSAFFLYYNNKIGVVNQKDSINEFYRLRTNIGNAYSTGVELYGEYIFQKTDSSKFKSTVFVNGSYVYARYGKSLEAAYSGKQIELVPPITVKTGIKIEVQKFTASLLATYVQQHYTDGTNAIFDPNAVAGIIPTYYVLDFNTGYKFSKNIELKAGINNLTNNKYFTRRASAYPGPGIIPSDGINFYITFGITL
ncbi:MAG: TonB-dependent receptor [Crocinitomicaceae bacterium]